MVCFQFTLVANDQGIPERTAEIPVRITVIRDEQPTRFINVERNVTITDKYQISSFVVSVPANDQDLRGVSTLATSLLYIL